MNSEAMKVTKQLRGLWRDIDALGGTAIDPLYSAAWNAALLAALAELEKHGFEEGGSDSADLIEAQAAQIAELEDTEHGVCDGCGSSKSLKEIRATGHISCCPERRMLSAMEWHERAERAEAALTAANAKIERMREALKQFIETIPEELGCGLHCEAEFTSQQQEEVTAVFACVRAALAEQESGE